MPSNYATSQKCEESINSFAYWVINSKLAAGEYPGNQFSLNPAIIMASLVHQAIALWKSNFRSWNYPPGKIGNLLDLGIDTFIDLTELGERPEYRTCLHLERRKRSQHTNYYRFPVEDRNVPDQTVMKAILDLIDSEIDGGRSVYVHCFRGLGRTGIVIGCYLVRQGMSGLDALNEIRELRKNVAGSFRGSPETEVQRGYVLDWGNFE